MISSLRFCRGHVPVPPVEVQVWCTPLEQSSGQISSPNFRLFPCVPHRGVGYNLWITSEALFGVKLEELSITSFCYTTPMCFSAYWETPSDFFPANQPPRCCSVHTCLLLQFSSKLCSLNPSAVCQAPISEWCSKGTIDFKSGPLKLATHCLLWACHRGVASLQPAVASSPPRLPDILLIHLLLKFPVVGEQSWLPIAGPTAPTGLPGLGCLAALRKY